MSPGSDGASISQTWLAAALPEDLPHATSYDQKTYALFLDLLLVLEPLAAEKRKKNCVGCLVCCPRSRQSTVLFVFFQCWSRTLVQEWWSLWAFFYSGARLQLMLGRQPRRGPSALHQATNFSRPEQPVVPCPAIIRAGGGIGCHISAPAANIGGNSPLSSAAPVKIK